MKIVQLFCDLCEVEIKKELSVYVFNDAMINQQLESVVMKVEAHYCPECTKKIVEYTKTLRNAKDISTK